MTAEELKTLHAEYRQAIEASRKPDSEEQAEAASAAVIDLRAKLDAALIEDKAEREDEQRAEAVEAREAAARKLSTVVSGPKPFISREKLADYLEGRTNQATFMFDFAEQRTDITNEVATTYGGYLVPQTWADKVYQNQLAQSGVLKAGPRILRTATGNQINYPTVGTWPVASAGTEGTAGSQVHPVFTTVPLNAYRVDIWMSISDELLSDAGVNLEETLGTIAGKAIGVKCAPYYNDTDVGTGSSLPAAVAIGSTSGKTAAGVDTVTLDELKELHYSVLPAYRANGAWVFNSDLFLETMMMKDDTGNYLVQPNNMANEPDMLWGKPMYEDAYADASGTSNVGCVLFGDFDSGYIVRFARGMEVSFSREFAFTSFETTMRAAIWHDAATLDTLAIKHLTLA